MRFSGTSIEMEVHTEGYSRFQFRGKDSELGGVSKIPDYPPGSNFFSLRMHYKGNYMEEPMTCYVLGKVVISDYCHPRNMPMQRFYETADYLGYEGYCCFVYMKPDKTTNNGFELVAGYADLRDIARIGLRNRVVDIYFLSRLRNRGIGVQPFVDVSNEVIVGQQVGQNLEHSAADVDVNDILVLNAEVHELFAADAIERNDEKITLVEQLKQKIVFKESAFSKKVEEKEMADLLDSCNMVGSSRKRKGEEILIEELEHEDDSDDSEDDSDDSEVDPEPEEENQQNQAHNHEHDQRFQDSDYEVEDDSDLERLMDERAKQWDNVTRYMEDEAGPNTLVEENESDPDWVEPGDDIESDDLCSLTSSGSDEDTWGSRKVRVMNRFVPPGPNEDVTFKLGQMFVSRAEFNIACKQHGTIKHRRIRMKRSNSKRCTAHCKTGKKCNWKVSINYRKATDSWELTALMLDHTCTPTFNHGSTTSRYLTHRYKEDIKIMPDVKVSQLVDKVRKDLHINISRDKAFNVKKMALTEIEGDLKKQYDILRNYCFELLRTNPNSTVLLQTERNAAGGELFQRMYVCFEACKRGFKEGCRPLIGIDGCHLTGPHKGILLAAIGMDANDQIFPVAYAVVEIENKKSWLWFLSALQSDLNIHNSKGWTLLSDKQKGLGSAMKTLLPDAEHRLCTWHMYRNFRGSHPGLELKEMVWAAAKCTNKKVFAKKMNDIQKKDPSAYQWLLEKTNPEEWSRAHFSTETKCDILVNNIVECFNKVILHARDKSIMTLLEALRFYFMDRLQKKRNFIARMQGELGPKVQKKLEKNMQESNHFTATHSGELLYEVDGFNYGKYAVNLFTKTCGCNRWELTGIPCNHAIAAINLTKEEPGSFVHKYYSKEFYQKAYKYMIYPMNGPELWEQSKGQGLLPPRNLRLPGRPEKARKKDAMEKMEGKNKKKKGEVQTLPRAKRMTPYQCRHCKQTGHNIKRCPLKRATTAENTPKEPASQKEPSIGKPEYKPTELASTSIGQQPKKGASKAKGKRVQTCSLCGDTSHNKTTCRSSVAKMKFRPPIHHSIMRGDTWPDEQ